MKFELNLTQNEHQYLLIASSHDRKFRSLQAFAKDCLLEGLNRVAAKDLGQRQKAVAALVGTQRRKS